ncbi:response regulator transcription factor [Brachybacterium sp. FME24]|uniref:response regulator transcription factor n=1 Tax=Brachybacterium sp. FME24 TaxID=2742605 RepID=UPI001865A998|nr:response regulator transcription factor [Brachybacterium sp. FME24]
MARILVVEDSPDVHALVVETLRAEGHTVHGVHDGLAARAALADKDAARTAGPDLVVLDLMLPHVDGSVLLAEIRRDSDLPVLVLSAKDAVFTKVDMLRLGADDYVTKPFDLTELTARIEALLRRSSPASAVPSVLRHGDLELDSAAARVRLGGADVALTSTELRILQLLLEQPEQVFSRPRIYQGVWGEPFLGDDAAVKTHLSNLRAKLREAAPDHDPIETVWGLGYRLRALPSA